MIKKPPSGGGRAGEGEGGLYHLLVGPIVGWIVGAIVGLINPSNRQTPRKCNRVGGCLIRSKQNVTEYGVAKVTLTAYINKGGGD